MKNSKMNEDITEEADEWRSADVEIYSAYSETTNTKPTEAETNRGCSSGTATTSQQPVSRSLQKHSNHIYLPHSLTLHNWLINKQSPEFLVSEVV